MKMNTILPFLIPIIIAGGLIAYNEMNNNVLLQMLNNNNVNSQVQNTTDSDAIEIEQNQEFPTVLEQTNTETTQKTAIKTVTLENADVFIVTETQVTITNNSKDIELNDIIVAGVLDNAPLGFLRKVTNISNSSGSIILQTEKASLSDAYANQIVNPVEAKTETNTNFSYTFQPSDSDNISIENEIIEPEVTQTNNSEFITELIESQATTAQKSYNCGSKGCFEMAFKNCTSAIGIDEILKPYSQKTKYEIMKKGETGCKVKTTFQISFFPDWEGKSITCELDNKLSITEAAGLIYQPNGSETLNCQGELLQELKKYGY